ncbi:glycerophosphodiester phosphodiesterase family protein [Nocardioides sp. AE5]|uniref:glycerophosphodiester phosphodiesterase family protein n=1 Tax=Nocardioides sp. AE5 TaxID=2962573 RepID=UPI0028818C96|nr:glycerophosphodiester phosphodiesterase family protein [Nocardioides sp. AE5]MDT0202006.1 glycerophosphodiester phosphodiesterase family protein [Nocardioides sp. AE5]
MSRTSHRAPVRSLVVTPAVVAHRGASGLRPEHTLEGYRLAVQMGADAIELDLVITADGVLVARHEGELSETTDVASRPEFADRRTTKVLDGVERHGWFVEDFTLAELKRLTARERWPSMRPESAAYDGTCGIPSLNEVLAMLRAESVRANRSVGLLLELKHAAYFASIGLPLDDPLLSDLARHEMAHPRSGVTVMSFEPTVLRQLATRTGIELVQLLETADLRPPDLAAVGDPRTYGDLCTPAGLAWIDEYADGIGVHKSLVLPRDASGAISTPSALVRDAHRHWLTVHVWTLRAENRFLPSNLHGDGGPGASGDLVGEARAFLDAGVDGLITDQPDLVLAACEGFRAMTAHMLSGSASTPRPPDRRPGPCRS